MRRRQSSLQSLNIRNGSHRLRKQSSRIHRRRTRLTRQFQANVRETRRRLQRMVRSWIRWRIYRRKIVLKIILKIILKIKRNLDLRISRLIYKTRRKEYSVVLARSLNYAKTWLTVTSRMESAVLEVFLLEQTCNQLEDLGKRTGSSSFLKMKTKIKISRTKKSKVKISRTLIKKSRRFRQTLHHMKMSKTWRTKTPRTRPMRLQRRIRLSIRCSKYKHKYSKCAWITSNWYQDFRSHKETLDSVRNHRLTTIQHRLRHKTTLPPSLLLTIWQKVPSSRIRMHYN